MRILVVGAGSGSWQMRGVQLGAAMGARVTSAPTEDDWRAADLIVLVKRAGLQWAAHVRRLGKPVVWDALDFWRQPSENRLDEAAAIHLLQATMRTVRPALVLGATQAQASAAPQGLYLPHHHRIGLTPSEPRSLVTTVGYEGSERYLGAWRAHLEAAVTLRGWRFVVNPVDLTQADILVAFRDGPWDGWLPRAWKSGIKIVNALAAGRPLITQGCVAADELGLIGTRMESPRDLDAALDAWAPLPARLAAYTSGRAQCDRFDVSAIASQYRARLAGLTEKVA